MEVVLPCVTAFLGPATVVFGTRTYSVTVAVIFVSRFAISVIPITDWLA